VFRGLNTGSSIAKCRRGRPRVQGSATRAQGLFPTPQIFAVLERAPQATRARVLALHILRSACLAPLQSSGRLAAAHAGAVGIAIGQGMSCDGLEARAGPGGQDLSGQEAAGAPGAVSEAPGALCSQAAAPAANAPRSAEPQAAEDSEEFYMYHFKVCGCVAAPEAGPGARVRPALGGHRPPRPPAAGACGSPAAAVWAPPNWQLPGRVTAGAGAATADARAAGRHKRPKASRAAAADRRATTTPPPPPNPPLTCTHAGAAVHQHGAPRPRGLPVRAPRGEGDAPRPTRVPVHGRVVPALPQGVLQGRRRLPLCARRV
jgi:hypothetical protein